MKQIKRILIVLIIITMLLPMLFPFSSINYAAVQVSYSADSSTGLRGLSPEQQNYIAAYVRVYLGEAHKMNPKPFIYDHINGGYDHHYYQNDEDKFQISELGQSGTNGSGVTYSNRMRTVCSVFTGSMIYQALGIDIWETSVRGAGYSFPSGRGKDFFNEIPMSEPLQPGDIIAWADGGHSIIYIGPNEEGVHEWAQTSGTVNVIDIGPVPGKYSGSYVTLEMLNRARGSGEVALVGHRLKPNGYDTWKAPEVTIIRWPNGSITEWSGEISNVATQADPNQPLFYSGIAEKKGTLGVAERKTFLETLEEVLDYILGIITYILRIPFVGLASVGERIIEWAMMSISSQPNDITLTLEKIIFNKVPIFDINIFNMGKAAGETLESNNIILILRENVAKWYYAFRNLTIALLLVVLIYLGIRMAITSVAEEKAQYKRLLVDWFISFFMVLFIHYFIVFIMTINEYLVNLIYEVTEKTNTSNLYEKVNLMAHSPKFSVGWLGTVMYIALIVYMVKYAWKYIKRILNSYILIMLSPLVAISYAIDKIKDNRSQSLGKWLKEIAFTILIQSVHALTYAVFLVGIISPMTQNDNFLETIGAMVFLIIGINFMDAAEDVFEMIFGFNKSSSTHEIMDSTVELFAKYKTAKNIAKQALPIAGATGKFALKATGEVAGLGLDIASKIPVVGKVRRNVSKKVNTIKDAYMDGYNLEAKGILPKDTKYSKYVQEQIKKKHMQEQELYEKQTAVAHKAWKTSTGAIKSTIKAVPMIAENPLSAITYMIAGGASAKHLFKLTKKNPKIMADGIKKATKGNVTKEQKLLLSAMKEDIKLKELIDDKYNDANSLLVRGFNEDATDEEKRQARQLQRIINHRLQEASKIVSEADVKKAVRMSIINATHQGRHVKFSEIISSIEENSGITVNKEALYTNIKHQIKDSLINSKKGKVESVKFGEEVLSEILSEKSKESIETQVNSYFSDITEEKIDEILESMDIEDISHILVRSINSEGSFERGWNTKLSEEEYMQAMTKTIEATAPHTIQDLDQLIESISETASLDDSNGTQRLDKKELAEHVQINIRDRLTEVQKVIRGEDGRELIEHLISSDRIDEITKDLEIDEITVDVIFEQLRADEKAKIIIDAIAQDDNIPNEIQEKCAKIVESSMQIPTSESGIEIFAQRMAKDSPNINERRFVQEFVGESHEYLEKIRQAIEGQRSAKITLLDDERIEEIHKSLEGKSITTDTILEELTIEEKIELFKYTLSNLSVQLTDEMDNELDGFNAIIDQAIRLRESAINATDRINVPMPDLVKEIREKTRRNNS